MLKYRICCVRELHRLFPFFSKGVHLENNSIRASHEWFQALSHVKRYGDSLLHDFMQRPFKIKNIKRFFNN